MGWNCVWEPVAPSRLVAQVAGPMVSVARGLPVELICTELITGLLYWQWRGGGSSVSLGASCGFCLACPDQISVPVLYTTIIVLTL